MRAELRYLTLVAARARTPLAPLLVLLFALVGTFADAHNEVGSTWALTALIGCGVSAWLVGAVLAGEPLPQADIATVALGGRGGRLRLELTAVAGAAVCVGVAFVVYPLLLGLVRDELFIRPVQFGDVVAALAAQLSCALLGGMVGLLFAPPRVQRRATAFGATTLALVLLVAVASPFGDAGGPIAVAHALDGAAGGGVPAAELIGCLSCLALVAALALAAAGWTRRIA